MFDHFFTKNKTLKIFFVFSLIFVLFAIPALSLRAAHDGTSHVEPPPPNASNSTPTPPAGATRTPAPEDTDPFVGPPDPNPLPRTPTPPGNLQEAGQAHKDESSIGSCLPIPGYWSLKDCLLQGATYVFFLIHGGFAWFLWLAAKLLNLVIAVQNTAFHDQAVVNIGWMVARDVVNIFFILALLVIAISTILGIGGYQAKNLLAKILISALLVNFSLAITAFVIDASTVLGNTFYQNIGKEQDAELKGIITDKNGQEKPVRDISVILVKAFEPQKILVENQNYNAKSVTDVLLDIGIAFVFGIILIAIAAFVILAAAIYLLVRIIALWLVMIFSPFAFLFLVLPHTKGYVNEWSQALIRYAFFYPAYMFMLYLVMTMIDKGAIQALFGTHIDISAAAAGGQAGISSFTSRANMVLGFIMLTGMMMASLLVAQKMSIMGSSTVMAYGKRGVGYARGKLRNSAYGTGRWAVRTANTQIAAPLSRKVLDHDFSRQLASIPLARRVLKAPVASIEKAEKDAQKSVQQIKNMSPAMAASYITGYGMSAERQAHAYKALDEKQRREVVKELEKKDPSQVLKLGQVLKKQLPKEKLHENLAQKVTNIETAMQLKHDKKPFSISEPEGSNPEEYAGLVYQHLRGLNTDDRKNVFTPDNIRTNEYVQNHIKNNFTIRDIQQTATSYDHSKAIAGVLKDGFESGQIAENNKPLVDSLRKSPSKIFYMMGRLNEGRTPDLENAPTNPTT